MISYMAYRKAYKLEAHSDKTQRDHASKEKACLGLSSDLLTSVHVTRHECTHTDTSPHTRQILTPHYPKQQHGVLTSKTLHQQTSGLNVDPPVSQQVLP